MEKTWTREPIAPAEGVGMVYTRNGYRVQRLGKANGWAVWHGADFLAPTPYLAAGKALATKHEIERARTLADYEYRARELSDWHLRQAYSGALMRNREDQAAIYRAELARREALKAAQEAAEGRARTEYSMITVRAPFSGRSFDHIKAPGASRTLCGPITGGPGNPLDLNKVTCLPCMQAYAAIVLSTTS